MLIIGAKIGLFCLFFLLLDKLSEPQKKPIKSQFLRPFLNSIKYPYHGSFLNSIGTDNEPINSPLSRLIFKFKKKKKNAAGFFFFFFLI
jgi:hypothetical protein